jgi:hypothetical protein
MSPEPRRNFVAVMLIVSSLTGCSRSGCVERPTYPLIWISPETDPLDAQATACVERRLFDLWKENSPVPAGELARTAIDSCHDDVGALRVVAEIESVKKVCHCANAAEAIYKTNDRIPQLTIAVGHADAEVYKRLESRAQSYLGILRLRGSCGAPRVLGT